MGERIELLVEAGRLDSSLLVLCDYIAQHIPVKIVSEGPLPAGFWRYRHITQFVSLG